MVYCTPLLKNDPPVWYFDPPTYDILTPLSMVYRPSTHDILTHLPMVYQTLLWYCELLSFGRNEGGGSIYHEGVQNTIAKIGPQGFSVRFFQPVYSI